MTQPLRLPAPLKALARAVRDAPLSNRLISAGIRALPDTSLRRRLIARTPRLGNVSVRLPDGGRMVMESIASESVTSAIFYGGWIGEEPEVLPIWRELVAHAEMVLDIGAHVGHFSVVAGRTKPALDIHCFEPLPRVTAMLRRNLELNGLSAKVHQLALNSTVGQVTFYAAREGIPSSSSLSREFMDEEHGSAFEEITVTTSTLDTLFPPVAKPVLIKIDTETTEPDVLAGGHAFIGQAKPIIFVEVLDRHETGPALHRELDAAGYRFTPYLMTDAGLVKKPQIRADARWRNFLLVPTDGPFMTPAVEALLRARMA